MGSLDRRTLLRRTAVAGGALLGLDGLIARGARAMGRDATSRVIGGYGPLAPAETRNTGETLLALPRGFEYTVFGKTGDPLSDGRPTPPAHDGMATFTVNGQLRIIRNHEVGPRTGTPGAAIGDGAQSYDDLAGGGTTTLIVDPETRTLEKSFVSLSGTLINCAGGPTPWGTWISCEETVGGPTRFTDPDGRERGGFGKAHGYCFEVPAAGDAAVTPVPLKAMGRFVHEAIAVDPVTGIIYETEDRGTAGFYRFLPRQAGRPAAGGRLQMLAIRDQPGYDTRTGQQPGRPLPVTWVDIEDPDPAAAETDAMAVYQQGIAKGAATFARLEGCWYGRGSIFLNSTSGGDRRLGQVWQYRPAGPSSGTLTLLFESPGVEVLDHPDNICVTPRGGLVLCEDGGGEQYVRGLTPTGEIFDFARNAASNGEFAGATFSPDGKTLFLNVQRPGFTVAIWGPWERGVL